MSVMDAHDEAPAGPNGAPLLHDQAPPSPVGPPNGVPLLATDPPRLGPVSRRLVARLAVVLGAMVAIGSVLAFASASPRARAAGLSLVFPGGGLLYDALPLAFLALMLAMALAVVLWWGLSAWWGIPAVWAVGVVAAVALADGPRLFAERGTTWGWAIPVVYALAAAALGVALYRFERTYRRKRAQVPELNRYLATAALPASSKPVLEPNGFDSELLRWVYDMALQPLDRFEGFDWGEQIHGPTCVRYQLDMLGWALSLFAANYVPNARQPVERALANLIEKQTDLRVWGYWRLLNLVGNLDANPDPIVRDNIMLSAYLADQINLYEAATGSDRFDRPGALTFVWKDGRTFEYDHRSVAEAVARNFEANELGLFPCEPGWVFTFCNVMGAQALKGHDTVHGTGLWPPVAAHWRRGVEQEMLSPDGHFPHIRSKIVGLSFDTGEVPGGEYYTAGTNRLADVAPDLAARGALLTLRGAPEKMAALSSSIVDGELALDVAPKPERNTLIKTAVLEWSSLIGTARAVGNEELAQAAQRRMDRTCATGRSWPERPLVAGVQTIGIHLMVRWGTPLGTAGLATRGYEPPAGPVLAEAPWPEVLVTKARSANGASLDLVVEPNRPSGPDAAVELAFEALQPGGRYVLVGDGQERAATADREGRATVRLALARRVALRLEPRDAAA